MNRIRPIADTCCSEMNVAEDGFRLGPAFDYLNCLLQTGHSGIPWTVGNMQQISAIRAAAIGQPPSHTGLAVLWATHLLEEVNTADRLLLLHQGTVRFNGGIDAFIAAAEAMQLQTKVLRSLQKA